MIRHEVYKIVKKRLFVACFLLFFIVNAFGLLYFQSNDLLADVIHKNINEYESIISDISKLSSEQQYEKLNGMLKTTEIALELDKYADSEDVESLESIRQKYMQKNPKEYNSAQELNLSRKELLDRYTYLENLVVQSRYITNYDNFIGNMNKRAEQQLKFSVFAEEGSFSYNNIKKTTFDFENLNGTQLEAGNNSAVENSTTFVLTDLLVFALVFLMCIYIFTFERDKGLYGLIRTSKNGRVPLIISKLSVLVFFTVLISLIYYSSNIAVCGLYSGFGDMTRNIQSSGLFMNCNLNLKIWQYLVLWCLSKIITMCVLALLIALIFVLIKNTAMIFVVTASAIFAEGIMYLAIGSNSPFNQLRYINFFYFLSGNNIFGNYLNVNLFSQPVNITVIYAVAMMVIAILSVTIICSSFVKSTQLSRRNIFAPMLEKLRGKFGKIQGSVSVFKGECFKHYKGSMAILVIVFLVFTAYLNLTDDISIVYTSAQESAYSTYMDELEGELTQEKEDFLQKQQDYFNGLNEELNTISLDTTLSAEGKEMKIMAVESILKTKGAAFEEISQQTAYIKEAGEKYNIKPVFVNNIVYKRLVENPTREWQYFTLLMAVIIFISSNIFAFEHKKHMINLIRCTQKGKLKLVLSKVMTITLTTIISYTLIYLPYYINFIKTFGTESFNTPIVFMQDFSNIGSTISVSGMIFVTAATHIMAAVTVMMAVAMFSQTLKNNILSMIVATVIVLFPCLLCMNLTDIRLYTSFQNGSWLWLILTLIIVCICIMILCFIATLCSFSKATYKAICRCNNIA